VLRNYYSHGCLHEVAFDVIGGGLVMKTILLGSLLIAGAGPAVAADMPVKAPVAAQKVFSWTGYYVGVNGGYAWDKAPTNVQPGPSGPIFVNLLPQVLDPRPRGYFGGGQIGSNWQYGSFVFGMESDLQSGISGTVVQSPIIQNNGTPFPGIPVLPGNNSVTISQKLDWWSTSRLRAGTTFVDPRLLLFVTAGAATAGISNTATTDFRPAGTTRYPVAFSETRVGLVVGAGAEWAFTNNLSIKAEYLFLDFGSSSMTTQAIPFLPPFTVTYSFGTQVQIVRAGLNLKFTGL
jgi:outer membrane immunogenic protein